MNGAIANDDVILGFVQISSQELKTKSSHGSVDHILSAINDEENGNVQIPVPLPQYTDIDEYIACLRKHNDLSLLEDEEIRLQLNENIQRERMRIEDESNDDLINKTFSGGDVDFSYWTNRFQSGIELSSLCTNEMADRFTYIMRNSSSELLTLLIRKEISMKNEVWNLIRARNWEVDQLTRECEEAFNMASGVDAHPHQLSRLNEKLRQVHGSYSCQIDGLCEKQRKDYKRMVDSIFLNNQIPTDLLINDSDVNGISGDRLNTSPDKRDVLEATSSTHIDESFTIYIGAQLKSMHNMRLMTCDSLVDICTPDSKEDMSYRLHMAMSLYGRNLTGLILLVPKDSMWHTTSRSSFARICELSTELHFEPLSVQLESLTASSRSANVWRNDNISPEEGTKKIEVVRNDQYLSVGDVYCTKHSNLKNTQMIFHLVIDDQLQSSDISSRHPCLNGIRNIIRLTARLGISSIYIPLLLIEKPSESTTIAWCIRRAEMVFKCVKGYLMEVCGSACGSSATGGVSQSTIHYNVHFVLPSGLTSSIYQQMTSMLPTIYHLVPSVNAIVLQQ